MKVINMDIIFNRAKPEAARQAQEQAHQRRAGTAGIHNRTQPKKKTQRNYRLSSDFQQYRNDEQQWREHRANSRRADIRALDARTFLHTQRTPRLTAHRLEFSQLKDAVDKARIARARDPQRQRAAMVRHMNTTCYETLVARGLR